MPASLGTEEAFLACILEKAAFTATKSWIGLSTIAGASLLKKTTGKEFGEKEPTEGNGWKRKETDTLTWTKEKAEGNTGKTVFKNAAAITFLKSGELLSGGEYKLETFALLTKEKQSEDVAESKEILVYGTLTTPVTVNSATTELKIEAGELKIECE